MHRERTAGAGVDAVPGTIHDDRIADRRLAREVGAHIRRHASSPAPSRTLDGAVLQCGHAGAVRGAVEVQPLPVGDPRRGCEGDRCFRGTKAVKLTAVGVGANTDPQTGL